MGFEIEFTENTIEDLNFFKKSGNKKLIQKIIALITEIQLTPYFGSGKPEQLKYNLTSSWSRRINKEHRLVYSIIGDIIYIESLRGHYE